MDFGHFFENFDWDQVISWLWHFDPVRARSRCSELFHFVFNQTSRALMTAKAP
jgi:hypothetical protein